MKYIVGNEIALGHLYCLLQVKFLPRQKGSILLRPEDDQNRKSALVFVFSDWGNRPYLLQVVDCTPAQSN